MKLTVQQRPDDSGLINTWSATFDAPGGTLGRSADNQLTLPDPQRHICRIQAAVRISDNACYLVNLSSMSQVSINGRPILRDQEVPLVAGDELTIGTYTLKAEDPNTPLTADAAVAASGFAALHAQQTDPALSEPDPLLESPLLDTAALAPEIPPAQTAPESVAPEEPIPTPATAAIETAPTDTPAIDTSSTVPVVDPSPADTYTAAPVTPEPFSSTAMPLENPFAEPPSMADSALSEAPLTDNVSSDDPNVDVFSDLFGPGTLPVGSVPDVSTHPFDMESAQTRNPEDPLRHLPRGDADVSGPLRDPLDLLDSHESDDVNSVFSDQTPSTLPSHDPLAPHRLDPVSDTLRNQRDHDNGGWAARDHLREYGGYLRPARVQQPAPKSDDDDNTSDTPRRK